MANFEQKLERLQREHGELIGRCSQLETQLLKLRREFQERGEVAPPPLPEEVKEAFRVHDEAQEKAAETVEPKAVAASVATTESVRKVVKKKAAAKSEKSTPARSVGGFGDFEQNFGSVWLVRLGVLLLLTGLVFLSTYAYNHFIVEWGAPLRVVGLYLVAALMVGGGTWLEKAKEVLKNYGNVLAAGGLATFFYTSYAAHHVGRLQVIESPFVGGLLLTASALGCLGYSLWKRSETTAVISLGLAFYSISINPIGWFTLFSGALLAVAGIVLLKKMRSLAIGFTTLLGAYLSYAYWNGVVNAGGISSVAPWFLSFYWIVFTAAIVFKKQLRLEHSVWFASLNNTLFLALFVIEWNTQLLVPHLWQSLGGFGALLVGISAYLKAKDPEAKVLHQTYLGKGLGLIILAMVVKLSGPALFMSLAVQSGVLFAMAKQRKNQILEVASWLTLALSGYFYFDALTGAAGSVTAMQHAMLSGIDLSIGALVVRLNKQVKGEGAVLEYIYWLFGFTALIQAVELQCGQVTTMLVSAGIPVLVYGVNLLVNRRSLEIVSSVLYLWTLSSFFSGVSESRWVLATVTLLAAVHYGASRLRVSAGGQLSGLRSWLAVVTGCFLFFTLLEAHKGWEISLSLAAVVVYLTREKGRQLTHNLVSSVMLVVALPVALIFAKSATLWQEYLVVAILALPYLLENKLLKCEKVNTRMSLMVPSCFLWAVASVHCAIVFNGDGLAICWAIVTFALLVSGLLLRETTLRVMGLLVMGATLLRVFTVDVWQLGTLMRILSFMSLGVALLVAGFLYCRVQDKGKE